VAAPDRARFEKLGLDAFLELERDGAFTRPPLPAGTITIDTTGSEPALVARTIMAPVVFTHAESDWVQLLTDTGLVGLLAVLATLGVIVVSCLRLRTRTRLDILAIGAAVAALGAASQGVGNFSFVVLSNLLYVAAAVGVVCPYLRGKVADHA